MVPSNPCSPAFVGRQDTGSRAPGTLAVLDPLDRLWRSTQTVVVDFACPPVVLIVFSLGSGRIHTPTSRLGPGIQEITFGSV